MRRYRLKKRDTLRNTSEGEDEGTRGRERQKRRKMVTQGPQRVGMEAEGMGWATRDKWMVYHSPGNRNKAQEPY